MPRLSESAPDAGDGASAAAPTPESPAFSLRQRLLLAFISLAGSLLVRAIGPTLRYRVDVEPGEAAAGFPVVVPAVYAFWHRCVLPASYYFRNRDIAVMTSRSFDGEYIARIIRRLGFIPVRGSSSRGAVGALLGMHEQIEAGHVAAFTIDGPRGPMYVAKPGPVLLARNTRTPLFAFYVAVDRAWVLNSWDRMVIPKPFSRAVICMSRAIPVPQSSTPDPSGNISGNIDAQMDSAHAAMQAALDRVRMLAEAALAR